MAIPKLHERLKKSFTFNQRDRDRLTNSAYQIVPVYSLQIKLDHIYSNKGWKTERYKYLYIPIFSETLPDQEDLYKFISEYPLYTVGVRRKINEAILTGNYELLELHAIRHVKIQDRSLFIQD